MTDDETYSTPEAAVYAVDRMVAAKANQWKTSLSNVHDETYSVAIREAFIDFVVLADRCARTERKGNLNLAPLIIQAMSPEEILAKQLNKIALINPETLSAMLEKAGFVMSKDGGS